MAKVRELHGGKTTRARRKWKGRVPGVSRTPAPAAVSAAATMRAAQVRAPSPFTSAVAKKTGGDR